MTTKDGTCRAAANGTVAMLTIVAGEIAREHGDLVATAALYAVANNRAIEHGGAALAAAALQRMADGITAAQQQPVGNA